MPDFSLGEWLPDQPQIALPGLISCENAIPTATGYESFPGKVEVGGLTALSAPCRGAYSGENLSGNRFIVAGTENPDGVATPSLNLRYGDSGAWNDVSQANSYSSMSNRPWDFDQYGNTLFAVAKGVTPQALSVVQDPSTSLNFSDLPSNASQAACAAVFKNFLILGDLVGRGTNASAVGTLESGIHWSSIGNMTGTDSWPTLGTDTATATQSDFQALDGNGGRVTAIVPGGEYCAIFQERQIWRLDYVGSPSVFSLRLIEPSMGCLIDRMAVAVNGMIYFLSSQGFMVFDGAQVRSIGSERVDKTWLENAVITETDNCFAAHNPENHCIFWTIPRGNSQLPSECLAYQYEIDRWFKVKESDAPRYETIFSAFESGVNESLDTGMYSTQSMNANTASTVTFSNSSGGNTTMYVTSGARLEFTTGNTIDIVLDSGSTFSPTLVSSAVATSSADLFTLSEAFQGSGNVMSAGNAVTQTHAGNASSALSIANLDLLGISTGRHAFGFFATDHKLNLYTNQDSPPETRIETGDYETPNKVRSVVNWIRPIFEGDADITSLSTSGKLNPNDATSLKAMSKRSGIDVWSAMSGNRVGGRYLRSFFKFGSGRLSSFSGFDVDLRSGGGRR